MIFAMLIYLLMGAWESDYGPKKPTAVAAQTGAGSVPPRADLPAASADAGLSGAAAPDALSSVAATAKVITVKTDVIALEIDTQGGTIRNLDLLEYPVEKTNTMIDSIRAMVGLPAAVKNPVPVRLLDASNDKLFLAQSGLIPSADSAAAANHYSVFSSDQDSYVLATGQDNLSVPLTWTDGNGLSVTKVYAFKRGSYDVKVSQEVNNNTDKAWTGRPYHQLSRLPQVNKTNFLMGGMQAYSGGVIYTQKDKYKKISFGDMEGENLDIATQGGWTAMIQHYFASAWIPPNEQENNFYTKALKDGQFVIGSYSPSATANPNSTAQFSAQLYAGPKVQPIMEKVATGLELTVDYSVLTFIGKPIYWLLNQIHDLTGNWGVAIMGVTLCIKLLFFPLSQASFRSMAKMRKIQPRLKELQDRYKDDRMRFNTEMMAMYKTEKVNPLGGCLPMLVQIPVFMCLYWVLSETVEFRQAPFILWVQDLSVEDPFYILPIIMGITMKIQQSLNPVPIDPIQAKVMKMFPLVFTVFFLFFPAGLVLYWVVNNTLSIIQQWYITKQINAEGLGHVAH
jgi:YidC/Oxa1 family membrane protein insertase